MQQHVYLQLEKLLEFLKGLTSFASETKLRKYISRVLKAYELQT